MEKRLVLIHLCPGPVADTCGSSVRVDCIAGENRHLAALHSLMLIIHLPSPTKLERGTTLREVSWPPPKAGGTSSPLGTPVADFGEGSCLHPTRRVVLSRWACRLCQLIRGEKLCA